MKYGIATTCLASGAFIWYTLLQDIRSLKRIPFRKIKKCHVQWQFKAPSQPISLFIPKCLRCKCSDFAFHSDSIIFFLLKYTKPINKIKNMKKKIKQRTNQTTVHTKQLLSIVAMSDGFHVRTLGWQDEVTGLWECTILKVCVRVHDA